MNDNFKRLIWLSGHFGIIIREHAEKLVYTGSYGRISANNTFAKLEREYGIFKRIDRGKRKTDGYKLTNHGVKTFRNLFGYEPKVYNSGDKLSHSVQVLNFYSHIFKDALNRGILENIYINEEKKMINFNVHRQIDFVYKNKNQSLIADAFSIYRFAPQKGIAFYLEIENSDRKSAFIANKTINNYEGYYISGKWKNEEWQPKNTKIFPIILVVCFSEWKLRELIRHFKSKISIDLKYYFTCYNLLEDKGFSSDIWFNVNNDKIKIIN